MRDCSDHSRPCYVSFPCFSDCFMRVRLDIRPVLVAALLAAALPSLLRAQSAPPSGGPASPAAPRKTGPSLVDFAAAGGGTWAWLSGDAREVSLYTGGPDAAPSRVAGGRGWRDLVLIAGEAWVLSREGDQGSLLRVPLQAGAAAVSVAGSLDSPGGLQSTGGALYWLEASRPLQPLFSEIPLAGPILRLRCRRDTGGITSLADWPAGGMESGEDGGHEVVGAVGGEVYFRVGRLTSTEFVRVSSGTAVRIAGEPGRQRAVIWKDRLYWTAPSEEANPESAIVCVRRLVPGSAPETVADWLPPGGSLVAGPDAVYYGGLELYRLPERPGVPEHVGDGSHYPLASDGSSILILGESAPEPLARDKD
jgi:hypothetical protein